MLEDYFQVYSKFGWLAFVFYFSPLIVSGVFLKKDKNKKPFIHYAVSMHGLLVVAVFIISWLVNILDFSDENWIIFLNVFTFLTLASIIFSFLKFTGNKRYHLLHLITLGVGPILYLISTMALTDRWL